MNRLKILTWHVHGNYLWYLSQLRHDLYLPVGQRPGCGYGGRGHTFPFGPNVHDVPVEALTEETFDCVLFQHPQHYQIDQYEILTAEQRRLPRIYLEHNTPHATATATRHFAADDAGTWLVHVTPFNALMWDSGQAPTRIIEHGVLVPESLQYSGSLSRGIVVVNHLRERGRLAGADVYEALRQTVPLDLVGMGAEATGGIGEVTPPRLAEFMADYRFFFHPARWTSLGLAVLEAMSIGLPVFGLAATELVTVIRNGESGYLTTDPRQLVQPMRDLLRDREMAMSWGQEARRVARERFGIHRFVADWERLFAEVTEIRRPRPGAVALDRTPVAPFATSGTGPSVS